MSAASGPGVVWLHVDAACIVVDKPAGLPSVPGRGEDLQDCLAARVQAAYADALVVHRLDMATSGLLLFARGPLAQRRLNESFAERNVGKRYVAVVHGSVLAPIGDINFPLLADWPNRPRQRVDLERGKPSLTRYAVLGRDAARHTTRLALTPLTGRSHQLRVHMQALGHPILGDPLYAPADVVAQANRLMLHAETLAFAHPASGEWVRFEAPAPF